MCVLNLCVYLFRTHSLSIYDVFIVRIVIYTRVFVTERTSLRYTHTRIYVPLTNKRHTVICGLSNRIRNEDEKFSVGAFNVQYTLGCVRRRFLNACARVYFVTVSVSHEIPRKNDDKLNRKSRWSVWYICASAADWRAHDVQVCVRSARALCVFMCAHRADAARVCVCVSVYILQIRSL